MKDRAELREIDMQTIRRHLILGIDPSSGKRIWGGLEWAIARTLNIDVSDEPQPIPALRFSRD